MALQSQTLRGASSRSHHSRARRSARAGRSGHKRALGVLLLLLVLGGLFVYLVRTREGSFFGPRAAKGEGVALQNQTPAASEPAVASAPPKPEPVILEMGAQHRPEAARLTPAPNAALPASPDRPSLARREEPPNALAQVSVASAASTPTSPTATAPEASPTNASSGLPSELAAYQAQAEKAVAERRLVEARALLNKIFIDPRVDEKDRDGIRRWMADLNRDLVFSTNVYPGDPLVETYKIAGGDSLIKISRKVNSVTEAGFIQRINGVSPTALRVGQELKIVKGPFHAVVSKSAFRMDIFAGPTPAPSSIGTSGLGGGAEPGWVYIRSFNVGLGEHGSTPLGPFSVKEGSKLINPHWVNPRTGEKFNKDDPKNPLGERWIGLVGLDDTTKKCQSYGIHATIDPGSIGKEMSMGCIRMVEDDVEIVYDMLMGRVSVVKIVP
ncbi:MAG TPA: L,D-transpeptidase family protein [Phycisphaerales bacterium]|jgi:LysM repeat protein|nr:L,D-transpeptidase family protein [Phycisphaerales bacterium]